MDEITNAPQEAMEKTPEELVIWVRERRPDDSYRQSIVHRSGRFPVKSQTQMMSSACQNRAKQSRRRAPWSG